MAITPLNSKCCTTEMVGHPKQCHLHLSMVKNPLPASHLPWALTNPWLSYMDHWFHLGSNLKKNNINAQP